MLHNSVDRIQVWWYNLGMTKSSIHLIAASCRTWAEEFAGSTEWADQSLNGLCAIASAKVFLELKKRNYRPEIHLYSGSDCAHCFVVVEDYIVDITATQFWGNRDQKVVILHEKEATEFEYYTTSKVFGTVKQLRKHQESTRWPSYQIAFDEYME